MNHALAKELEKAGYIMPGHAYYGRDDDDCYRCGNPNGKLCRPTLEELIEACGEDFISLTKEREWTSLGWWPKGEETTTGYTCPSAEEAVARLWLALKKVKVTPRGD